MNLNMKFLIVAAVAATPLLLWSGGAAALTPIEELGKAIFNDTAMSIPNNKQGCVSCHDPKVGWVLNDPKGQGAAAGAHPGAIGNQKPPSAAYAKDSPVFDFQENRIPPGQPPGQALTCSQFSPAPGNCFIGGVFWNGRAEGCGKGGTEPCKVGDKAIDTITPAAVGIACPGHEYCDHLGPLADQAAAPFVNPVEQNSRMKKVCQRIKTAPYKDKYFEAFGEPIDCTGTPDNNANLKKSYLRAALAIAAYERSTEVNPFSSRREACLAASPGNMQGCGNEILSSAAKAGHALFYRFGPGGAACTGCHNNGAGANGLKNTYTDSRYHHLPLPYNRNLKGVAKGTVTGLSSHVTDGSVKDGEFKTPTLLNVALGEGQKTYMHNGYLKTLKQVVHFYNTATDFCQTGVPDPTPNTPCKLHCEALGLVDATAEEAISNNCWPKDEFEGTPVPGIVGNLNLTLLQEDQLVEYMRALSDGFKKP